MSISGLKQYEKDVATSAMKKLNDSSLEQLKFFHENIEDFIYVVIEEMERNLPVTPGAIHYVGKMIEQRLRRYTIVVV